MTNHRMQKRIQNRARSKITEIEIVFQNYKT